MYRPPVYRPPPPPVIRRQPCPRCNGNGKIWQAEIFSYGWKPCPDCKGKGYIEYRGRP